MSKMKESGIAWVGDMPVNWTVKRGKYTLNLLNRPVEDSDEVITCFRDGEVTLRKNRREDGFTVSLKEIGYQGLEPGDLVIHGMDGFAGAIGISDSRGKSSPVLVVCDSDENKKYIMYYLRSMAYNDVFTALATGIRVRSCDLRWNKLAELPYILPSLEEQSRIVQAIDNDTAKVESLIANVRAQIDKLKAYKQSLITEAVTKGLDQSAPVKESGVDWIDTIPQTWHTSPLKALFSFGKGLPITKENLTETGIPVISYGQIHAKWNTGVTTHEELYRFVSEEYLDSNHDSLVHKGDMIMADTSEDKEGCGNCAYIDTDDTIFAGYHTIILKSLSKTNTKYLAYLFLTDHWRSQLRKQVSGVKLFSVSKKILGSTTVLIPDCAEEIVAYLDDKCSQIDALIRIKQAKIEKLERFKKSIIYEYVTGKKEVQ